MNGSIREAVEKNPLFPLERGKNLYNTLFYDEVWTIRNMFRRGLVEQENTIRRFQDIGTRGYNVDSIVDNAISDYYQAVDLAIRRLTSPSFDKIEVLRWIEPKVF